MHATGFFLQEMMMLYGMAILGFIVRKTEILNEHTNEVLTQLILYITLPALILFSLDIPFSFTIVEEFLWLITMSAYVLIISSFLAKWLSSRSQLSEQQSSVYEGLIIFGNQGFIGFAVIYILFGQQGILYLTIFNICYLIVIWTYGLHLFNKNNAVINWRRIGLNPGILSTVTGLLIFFLPLRLPVVISNSLEMIGMMTIPLSMMVIGSLMANVNFKSVFHTLKNRYLWIVVFTRLLFIPFLLLPFSTLSVPTELLFIAVLVSGMPSAPTISLYAQKYGADAYYSSIGVILTTMLCMITIPFLYFLIDLLTN